MIILQTNANITVYTKSTSSSGNTWTRTVVKDVMWQETRKVGSGNAGLVTQDEVKIFIPFSSTSITIKKEDIVVLGEINFVLDETNTAKNVKTLKATYPDVHTIKSVSKNNFGSDDTRHWKVIAL